MNLELEMRRIGDEKPVRLEERERIQRFAAKWFSIRRWASGVVRKWAIVFLTSLWDFSKAKFFVL